MTKEANSLKTLLVVGNLAKDSTTRIVLERVVDLLSAESCDVDLFDCAQESLPLFDVQSAYSAQTFPAIKERVMNADVIVLGTPDYHGCMSSATKNFLDHFWKEYGGKLFASIVGSYEKGLTVHDQIRTVARQCYAWSLPYGVSFHEKADLQEGKIVGEDLNKRLQMLASDVARYGRLLADQRAADLASSDPGFMAHYR